MDCEIEKWKTAQVIQHAQEVINQFNEFKAIFIASQDLSPEEMRDSSNLVDIYTNKLNLLKRELVKRSQNQGEDKNTILTMIKIIAGLLGEAQKYLDLISSYRPCRFGR